MLFCAPTNWKMTCPSWNDEKKVDFSEATSPCQKYTCEMNFLYFKKCTTQDAASRNQYNATWKWNKNHAENDVFHCDVPSRNLCGAKCSVVHKTPWLEVCVPRRNIATEHRTEPVWTTRHCCILISEPPSQHSLPFRSHQVPVAMSLFRVWSLFTAFPSQLGGKCSFRGRSSRFNHEEETDNFIHFFPIKYSAHDEMYHDVWGVLAKEPTGNWAQCTSTNWSAEVKLDSSFPWETNLQTPNFLMHKK